MVRVAVAIPAAGVGARMGERPKQYLELAGEPVLLRALRPFLAHDAVTCVVVALPPADAPAPPPWLAGLSGRVTLVAGGATRGDSVRAALERTPADVDVVLIHDAARPLVTAAVIDRCVEAAARGVGAVAAWPVTDTVKEVDEFGRVVATPDRGRFWRVQTPQAFPREMILQAYRAAATEGLEATDDAALVERYGGRVVVVEGAPDNIKLTRPEDLAVAETLLALRS